MNSRLAVVEMVWKEEGGRRGGKFFSIDTLSCDTCSGRVPSMIFRLLAQKRKMKNEKRMAVAPMREGTTYTIKDDGPLFTAETQKHTR